jgi:hypothetical protein
MIIVFKSIVKCEIFGLHENFQGSCFAHVFSKACQYVTIDKKKIARISSLFQFA